ncbi:TIGR01906 family membrane protein [Anaeromicrobium sediminis]|uniref:TIGR01906 family membrane protein n=1 Tax=Anaeromicrobium sediminis TaxID=1478221 RepID=A0A267MGS2_9FIRM|nr:TIGR01906 family membrane protein [Anaeromicrobium sediminis]
MKNGEYKVKRNKHNATLIWSMLIIICLPIVILLTVVQINAFNEEFYMTEYKKYNISSVTGMEFQDLNRVTTKLINYINDDEDNLKIYAKIQGEKREVFGQREKQHMVDVKKLFQKGFSVRNFSLSMVILALSMLSVTQKDMYKSIFYSSLLALIVTVSLIILIKIDFYKYFTYFHEVFFNNDLWLLDPRTDVLINMLPLEFFIDITSKIGSWFLAIQIIMFTLSLTILKKD